MNFSFAVGLINVVNSANYLGVMINNKLNFQEHIKYSERKVSRSVGMLRKLKKYLPELALFKQHYTLIHSHLIYKFIVWKAHFQAISPNRLHFQTKLYVSLPEVDGINILCRFIKILPC